MYQPDNSARSEDMTQVSHFDSPDISRHAARATVAHGHNWSCIQAHGTLYL
jgi:hypothetical protein